MRLSELILGTRHKVNDLGKKYHSDQDIVFWLNRMQRDLFRKKADADESYGQSFIDILGADTTRVQPVEINVWRYYMPSWVYRVHRPHLLVNGLADAKVHLDRWKVSTNRCLDLWDTIARDLRITISKVPAMMRPGTVAVQSAIRSELLILVDDPIYAVDREDGCLIGAAFEITSCSDLARDCRGSVAVVTAQRKEVVEGVTGACWRLTVTPPFPDTPFAGDTFEMHSEIEDVHADLLMDRTAKALLQRQGNASAVDLLRADVAKGEAAFVSALRPRADSVVQTIYEPDHDARNLEDPDRDPYWNSTNR